MKNEYAPQKLNQVTIDDTLSFFTHVYNECMKNTFYPITKEREVRKISSHFVSEIKKRGIIVKLSNNVFIWKGDAPTEELIIDIIKTSYYDMYLKRTKLEADRRAAVVNDVIEEPIVELDKFGFPIEKPINEIHFEIPSSIAEETQTSIDDVTINDDLKNLSIQILLVLITKPNVDDVEQLTDDSIDLAKSLLRKL